MPNSIEVRTDKFANTFSGIIRELSDGIEAATQDAVVDVCKFAKGEVKENASALGLQDKNGTTTRYISGFTYKVNRNGNYSYGEVGNKKIPGLVHLLEKGHYVMGGGRARAFPHMEPAYDSAVDRFPKLLKNAVRKHLRRRG